MGIISSQGFSLIPDDEVGGRFVVSTLETEAVVPLIMKDFPASRVTTERRPFKKHFSCTRIKVVAER